MVKRFTETEIKFIRENKEFLGNKEIGEKLGRSASAIGTYMVEQGIKRSPESFKKILSEQKLGEKNPMFGKVGSMKDKNHTEEVKMKISLANKGRIPSEQTLEKMRKAKNLPDCGGKETRFKKGHVPFIKGKTKENCIQIKVYSEKMTGRIRTSEHSKHISEGKKGYNPTQETKRKIGLANKGKIRSLETRGKMGLSAKVKWQDQNYRNKMKANRAKQILPKRDTSIELKLQNFLQELKLEFFTHGYMKIEHAYQCDISIPVQPGIVNQIIIEADGDYWHGNPKIYTNPSEMQRRQIEEDFIRTRELKAQGFKVLRLWESEIKKMNLEDFKNKLLEVNNEEIIN